MKIHPEDVEIFQSISVVVKLTDNTILRVMLQA